MTKPKNKKIQNDKNIFQNLNDVHILNDVEKEGNLCGPENSEKGKLEATHEVGDGSESEKDEKEEDSNAESWGDIRMKGWLRPRVKTRRMNESAPESFWRQRASGPRSVLFPETATSDPQPHSALTCRSCRFSSKMSISSNADDQRSPRRGSPSPTQSPRPPGSPSPTPSSPSSGEPLGLDEGEEFILVKVSKKKGKCWATFLNDDPDHSCGGHEHFALSTSIEEILERRKRHHAKLDETNGKKEAGTLSQDRAYRFSNLNVREQGEEPSPGLRKSSKSIPPNNESSSSEPWNPDWEGRTENEWREETESWGTPYHYTPEHRAQAKAVDASWGETRMRHQRAERDAIMEGGSSPPSKKRTASKTFMDDIDDPNGEVRQSMTAQERREQDRFSLDVKSPKGYKTREVQLTRTDLWGDEQSSSGGESVAVKVTWEPETGSRAKTIVKEIRLNPDKIDEGGMTWDSDAMNPKGEADPRVESTSGMMTRSSAKKGKVSMKRKPRLAGSLTGRRAAVARSRHRSPLPRKGPKA
jgi:hypothetical protein